MVALRLRVPVTAVLGETAPVVWVLHDGKPGMASQALGLAEATGFPFVERRLAVRPPWTWLPPQRRRVGPYHAVAAHRRGRNRAVAGKADGVAGRNLGRQR